FYLEDQISLKQKKDFSTSNIYSGNKINVSSNINVGNERETEIKDVLILDNDER
ncbi:3503_t:CDS:1, partial [Diversispora eburnea]